MNMPHLASEILINATLISEEHSVDLYEFVLNQTLTIIECVHVESLSDGIVFPVPRYKQTLKGVLFELNHVRVNPYLDNSPIIGELTNSLRNIGVHVSNPPGQNSIAICFKPLGEITDNVRFYFDADGQITFLTPSAHLHIVHTPPHHTNNVLNIHRSS